MISINTEQCLKTSYVLAQIGIREDFYNRPFIRLSGPAEKQLIVYLFSTAICHQTYTLHHPEKNLFGWEFIESVFLEAFNQNTELINPECLAKAGTKEIKVMLRNHFKTNQNPTSCTLDRLEERSFMLYELSQALVKPVFQDPFAFISVRKNKTCEIEKIYQTLGNYKGFEDPLKKKITFFVKLATDAGLFNITDPQNIVPIMDYHMQRVLMRLGCVEINDALLRNKLIQQQKVDSDQAIRNACNEAIRIIADKSGHPILAMNDFFWPMGRSCCNEKPKCEHKKCEKSPCTFFTMVNLKKHDRCIFQDICMGAFHESYRKLWQPVIETHYY